MLSSGVGCGWDGWVDGFAKSFLCQTKLQLCLVLWLGLGCDNFSATGQTERKLRISSRSG